MKGEVIRMGTMIIEGEQLTGVFVMCDPDEFHNQTENILYEKVEIKRENHNQKSD